MSSLCRAFAVAAVSASLAASATPVARLAADRPAGPAPLVVVFDVSRSTVDNPAEELVLMGNGDGVPVSAMAMAGYNFVLPGAYQAQAWVRDGSGAVAASVPLPLRVARVRDGRMPPSLTVTTAPTTDPTTIAFMATLAAAGDDAVVARRWEFGDGATSGEEQPLHKYAQPGLYQAMLVATTKSGLPAYGRVVVLVGDASAPAPSLLVAVTPEDASELSPLVLTAYLEGVAPSTKVTSAVVAWPDLEDASPTVTPAPAGITVTSQHALPQPGYFDVAVTVQLDGRPQPLTAVAHVTVANIDGSAPSPVVLMEPVGAAQAGVPYQAGGGGPTASSLLVAGNGPFAFGVVAPSPAGFTVDDAGRVSWTPTRAEVGAQRLAVRIVDADGNETTRSWVVDVAMGRAGCALAGAPSTGGAACLLLLLALVAARYGVTARQAPKQGTNSCAPPASVRGSPTPPPT